MRLFTLSRSLSQTLHGGRLDRLSWAAAAVSGLLLVLAFPKFALSLLAWVALAPLLWAVTRDARTKSGVGLWQAFGLGWVTGLIYAFFSMNWIAHSMMRYGGFALWLAYGVAFIFACVLALFPALFAATVNFLARAFGAWAVVLAPTLWVASEWLREMITGVTWNQLGVTQARYFAIASLAQFGGTALVGWVTVAGSAVLVLVANAGAPAVRRAVLVLAAGGALLFLFSRYNTSSDAPPAGSLERLTRPGVLVAGVQPNVPLNIVASPEEFARETEKGIEANIALMRRAIDESPYKSADIVVWAESPLALNYEQDATLQARLDALARETNSYLIFSAVAHEGEKYFNSAETVAPGGAAVANAPRRYDKMRLVPFGEYVPLRSLFGRFVPTIVGDFTPGHEAVVNVLKVEGLLPSLELTPAPLKGENGPAIEKSTIFARVGTFICYEAAYPRVVRQFVVNGATLLINISDDAWFGATAGPLQHLDHARMRAIENDRDLVRVTNSGISALITARGEVVDTLPQFTAAARVWEARVRSEKTFYTRHGDWFVMLCVAAGALAIAAGFARQFRRQQASRK